MAGAAAFAAIAASVLQALSVHPYLRELLDSTPNLGAAASAFAGAVAAASRAHVHLAPPPPTFGDVAPLVAQAGHRDRAVIFAQVSPALRRDERVWRALMRHANARGLHRRTHLSYAARKGDLARCEFLVEHGAPVAHRDAFGRSALTEALAGGHAAVAVFLRANGAEEDTVFGGVLSATWAPVVGAAGADGVFSLAVLEGGLLAMGHVSGDIRLRNTATGAVTITLPGHTSHVRALVLLPGGRRLASASDDRSVRVWNVAAGVAPGPGVVLPNGHTAVVSSLCVLRNGCLASGSADHSVRLWDLTTLSQLTSLPHDSAVCSLAALGDGGLACGLADGRIALWSAARACVGFLGGGEGFGAVRALTVLHDGRLASGSQDTNGAGGLIRVWDLQRRALDAELSGHTGWVWALAPLPDGRLLSCSRDRTVKAWAVPHCSPAALALCAVSSATLDAGFGPNLARLPCGRIVNGDMHDGSIRVWA